MMNKAFFLDRDGVINKEKDYVYKIEDFDFIDGVFEVCKYLQTQDYLIIIITNQAGIARGKYTEEDYQRLTNWMINEFEKKGIKISKVYHCPHHPDFSGTCDCRKPKAGMILQAKKDFDIDLSQSILVGDKNSDIEAGVNAGIRMNYLVETGHKILSNPLGATVISSLKDIVKKGTVCFLV